MDRNPPANAGDMGSIPGPGRFHMPWSSQARTPQPPSLCAATPEARGPEGRVAPAHGNWRKPEHSHEDPAQPKINKYIFFKKKKKITDYFINGAYITC